MKKITTILGLLFLSMTILSSCEDNKSEKENKKDKYKKEIKDPCDILDYSIEIFEDLLDLSDKYDDIDDLEDDKKDKKKVNAYFDDLEDAWKYAFKEFEAEEMMEVFESECRNDEDMEESMAEIKDFYEERYEVFLDFAKEEVDNMEKDTRRVEETVDAVVTEEAPRYETEEVEARSYDYAEEEELQFMEDFMEECTSDDYYAMYDYCECALEELMYEYTIDEMDYLDTDEAIDFIKYNTDCLELIGYDEDYE
jgi:hypothetical protein